MMSTYLNEVEDWSILPVSVAKEFCKDNKNLSYILTDDKAPTRTAFLLRHKSPTSVTEKVSD